MQKNTSYKRKNPSLVFNPIKESEDGKKAMAMVWSTKTLEMAKQGMMEGKKLIANPFYDGNNIQLLKPNLVFQRTPEEIEEWKKCSKDIIYFTNRYAHLMTPQGIRQIILRDYQKKYLQHLVTNRLSIYLACRQCSKTTMSALYLLHYIIFNTDKTALIVANKLETSKDIIAKMKAIYLEIPWYLKSAPLKWNETEVSLDNGCRIKALATTPTAGAGYTAHMIMWDEAALTADTIVDKFYNFVFPTITAGKAKFIISSTQNGRNLFYRLYTSAVQGENDYAPFKTDWWEVPEWNPDLQCWEPRTEEWHQRQVANLGSEEAFNWQFGTNFDISSNTLITQKILQKKNKEVINFIPKDLLGVPYSDRYFWYPDYDPMTQLKRDFIVCTIDLAEGLSGSHDNTVCQFHKILPGGKTKCVGYFRANDIDRESYALSFLKCWTKYCNPNQLLISFEKNTYGDLFLSHIMKYVDTDQEIANRFDTGCFIKYYNETGTKYVYGIKQTSGNKTSHCILFKEDYEKDNIVNESVQFMNELENFNDTGNGHYKASFGHDDLVMAQMQIEFVKETLQWKNMISLIPEESRESSTYNGDDESTIYNPFENQWDVMIRDAEQNDNLNRLIRVM